MDCARKAFAYITRAHDLLVLAHLDHPDVGLQVPSGTLHDGEDPAVGVVREAREETGFSGLSVVRALGSIQGHWGIDAEIHAFHMVFSEPVPERWEHGEFSYGEPIRFGFSWMAMDDPNLVLSAPQESFLAELKRVLGWV